MIDAPMMQFSQFFSRVSIPFNLSILLWVLLIAIMPMEHVPALRLVLLFVLFIFLLIRNTRPLFYCYIKSWPMLLWAVFCCITYFWSIRPQSTAFHLRADLFPSIIAFGVFSIMAKDALAEKALQFAILLLSIVNAILGLFGQRLHYKFFEIYYSDVGYSSTFAVVSLVFALSYLWFRRTDKIAVAILFFSIAAGIASANRLFILVLLFSISFFCVAYFWSSKNLKNKQAFWAVAGCGALVLIGVMNLDQEITEKISRLWVSGDARPKIWAAWLEFGMQSPILGVGYGRNVGQYYFGDHYRSLLVSIDAFAIMHSHNIFLNSFVETGVVGLCLFLLMWASFASRLFKSALSGQLCGVAGFSVLFVFLLKNQTDIFFIKSSMVLIMGLMGYYTSLCSLQQKSID